MDISGWTAKRVRASCGGRRSTFVAGIALFALLASNALADPAVSQVAFGRAMEAAALGDWETAVGELAALDQADPTPRVKLELARAYLASGQPGKAYRLFRRVHDDPATPPEVKRNILPFMERAEVMSFRFRWGVRLATDSNPSRVSDGATVYFNGIPFEYRPPERRKRAVGAEPWLTAEKMLEGGALAKGRLSARMFREDGLSSLTGHASFAAPLAGVDGAFVQVALDGRTGGGQAYAMPSVEGWRRFGVGEAVEFGAGGQVGYMSSSTEGASGPYWRPYAFVSAAVGGSVAFARVSMDRLDASNPYFSHVTPKVEAGMSARYGGLDVTPRIEVARARFDEVDWFWGVRRKDLTVRPSVSLSHDAVSWKGFKPELDVFYETRSSSVPINGYTQFGTTVSLVRKF